MNVCMMSLQRMTRVTPRRRYAVVLNTNLGGSNPVQNKALLSTLAWIWLKHGSSKGVAVYVLGHHPSVMSAGSGICDSMLPQGPGIASCKAMIKGVFAGHVHYATTTSDSHYTLVPAVSQYGSVTGFWIGKVSESEPEFKVNLNDDLFTYKDKAGQLADKTKWTGGGH